MDTNWVENELRTVGLGDHRLNKWRGIKYFNAMVDAIIDAKEIYG